LYRHVANPPVPGQSALIVMIASMGFDSFHFFVGVILP